MPTGRQAELTGIVKPEVDEQRLDQETSKVQQAMDKSARLRPEIDVRGLRRKIERAIPGGGLVGGGIDRLTGRGGPSGASGGAVGGGLQAAQLEKLSDIHEELEKIGASGGMGGGGAGGGGGGGGGLGLGFGLGTLASGGAGGVLGGVISRVLGFKGFGMAGAAGTALTMPGVLGGSGFREQYQYWQENPSERPEAGDNAFTNAFRSFLKSWEQFTDPTQKVGGDSDMTVREAIKKQQDRNLVTAMSHDPDDPDLDWESDSGSWTTSTGEGSLLQAMSHKQDDPFLDGQTRSQLTQAMATDPAAASMTDNTITAMGDPYYNESSNRAKDNRARQSDGELTVNSNFTFRDERELDRKLEDMKREIKNEILGDQIRVL